MNCSIDSHFAIIIGIIIFSGAFGGLLNYLHNFDMLEKDVKDNKAKLKYILLGIGAALLVPAFLKMISSSIADNKDNNSYLVFAGFCLIAAIFSRRFINTVGEKILDAAKQAKKTANESKKASEQTQLELTSTKERIEDVKLAIDLNSKDAKVNLQSGNNQKQILLDLASSYIERTSVPNYSERIKLKAELGRRMGEIIVRNNLSKHELLSNNPPEGLLLAISYSIQLRPDKDSLLILNKISLLAEQLYTKYSILVAYDTLARNGLIEKEEVNDIYNIINKFTFKADSSLIQKIKDSVNILSFIDPSVKK